MLGDTLVSTKPFLEVEEFQAIVEHLPFPFAYLDRELHFMAANEACAELLDRPGEALLGRGLLELLDPREVYLHNPGNDERTKDSSRNGKVSRGRWRLTALKDGRGGVRGYLLSPAGPAAKEDPRRAASLHERRGNAGETSGISGGERRDASPARLETVFAHLPQGLLVLDHKGVVRRANRSALAILGLDPVSLPQEEILRAVSFRRLNGALLPPEELPFSRALHGETVAGEVLTLVNARGRSFTLLASAAPWPLGENCAGAIVSWYDLGDLRPLEEAQGDYLRIISHDLRQPLTVIAAQAQLLERAADRPEKVRRGAQAIYATVWRMNAMIQDLVDAAHFESGHLRLRVKEIDLAAYLHDLLERLEAAMETERIAILPSAEAPRVLADPDRLERILVNLLSNALKYSEPGSPVTIAARGGNGQVVVSVSDHGRGIDPDELPYLFGRYYRSPAVRDHAEGLGLGLYITKILVEAHGGRIWVESVKGVGSTFHFALPHVPASSAEPRGEERDTGE